MGSGVNFFMYFLCPSINLQLGSFQCRRFCVVLKFTIVTASLTRRVTINLLYLRHTQSTSKQFYRFCLTRLFSYRKKSSVWFFAGPRQDRAVRLGLAEKVHHHWTCQAEAKQFNSLLQYSWKRGDKQRIQTDSCNKKILIHGKKSTKRKPLRQFIASSANTSKPICNNNFNCCEKWLLSYS